ncbi:uncharacterized protein si:ch211-1a19.3 [Hypomesus transpacificus]|uniref:uncharacterized protein si:ch211-1a19.3 n=1 Tax=Hypomesus transpacificus TaxID=137520 RepID=UPI001F0881F5|nr:uncharacterized protein si:ch211-1a19.3 [Hypomesus transpacificus]
MGNSKSSQTTRNIIIALLALWSVISLIIIVVWATTPDMKNIKECQARLQKVTVELEGAKVVFEKNKVALEEMVEESRANLTRQRQEIDRLLERLGNTNTSLDDCRLENVNLNLNITVLENEIEKHKEMEANLTDVIKLHKDNIENLQENLTQASHQMTSCQALNSAAESQKLAAESQTKACESSKLYIQKQLLKCRKEANGEHSEYADDGCVTPRTSILALAVVLCTCLHLIT